MTIPAEMFSVRNSEVDKVCGPFPEDTSSAGLHFCRDNPAPQTALAKLAVPILEDVNFGNLTYVFATTPIRCSGGPAYDYAALPIHDQKPAPIFSFY